MKQRNKCFASAKHTFWWFWKESVSLIFAKQSNWPKGRFQHLRQKTAFEAILGLERAYFLKKTKIEYTKWNIKTSFLPRQNAHFQKKPSAKSNKSESWNVSETSKSPRRSQSGGQESEQAQKATFIICGKKYPPRTLFSTYCLRRPKKCKNWCVFNIFIKSTFFIIIGEDEIKKKMLILMHYLQHFQKTDDFRSKHGWKSLYIKVPHYQPKL